MGINAEMIEILCRLRKAGALDGAARVAELGAQDISAPPEAVRAVLARHSVAVPQNSLQSAREVYTAVGLPYHVAIDATGAQGAHVFDLNLSLAEAYGFRQQFDVVTNLGTGEHVFNQYALFSNMHALCRVGGVMIHCLPSQGLVNHGFYNYHPRLIADLAAANAYEILSVDFTCDFKPVLFDYTLSGFRAQDHRDVMVYAVLRRTSGEDFRTPFDSVFKSVSRLSSYAENIAPTAKPPEEFAAYIKTAWTNATAPDLGIGVLDEVATEELEKELRRRGQS